MSIENFTGKAEAYTKGRPGYPQEAIEYICSLVPANALFADIGAGTGKFTIELAKRGYSIFAVEPNADMLGQLTITLAPFPNIKIINSTAETTTIPEHSVDVVTIAHALHWFNLDAFRTECRRIIKPGGLVIAIFNLSPGGEMISLSEQTTDAFFNKPEIFEFPNPMDYTRDMWLNYIASQDNYPMPGDPEYNAHIDSINTAFDRDSINGLLRINRITKIYSEKLE